MQQLDPTDRIAIQELLARFYQALEGGDAAGVAATMVHDGALVMRAGNRSSPATKVFGREAIEGAVSAYLADKAGTHIRHLLSNFILSPCADGVVLNCSILAVDTVGGLNIVGVAIADCLAVRSDGAWSLARFDHYLDPPDPKGF